MLRCCKWNVILFRYNSVQWCGRIWVFCFLLHPVWHCTASAYTLPTHVNIRFYIQSYHPNLWTFYYLIWDMVGRAGREAASVYERGWAMTSSSLVCPGVRRSRIGMACLVLYWSGLWGRKPGIHPVSDSRNIILVYIRHWKWWSLQTKNFSITFILMLFTFELHFLR